MRRGSDFAADGNPPGVGAKRQKGQQRGHKDGGQQHGDPGRPAAEQQYFAVPAGLLMLCDFGPKLYRHQFPNKKKK